MRPALTTAAAVLLALAAALPAAAQPADGGDCADGAASPAQAEIELAPAAAPGTAALTKTYSRNPFIVFKFPCAVTAELTALTLNGEDVLGYLERVASRRWVLMPRDLALGGYELVYSARDGAGNAVENARFVFEVLEYPLYRVPLETGWNLISFPGELLATDVGSAIGSDKRADAVLGYTDGDWNVAVRSEDGWQGDLKELRCCYGYWVRTSAVEVLDLLVIPVGSHGSRPTIRLTEGWNLVGVIDIEQHAVGSAGAVHDADEYFQALCPWKAYGYVAGAGGWEQLLPESTPPAIVENGRGYWLRGQPCYYHP